jgi:HlyD family secretion protein
MSGWLCMLPLAASLFQACGPAGPLAVGYVEGEYALVAPIAAARLSALKVRRGDRMTAGQVIAEQETEDAELACAKAKAALEQAKARLRNLEEGKRPQEIAVIEATLRSAQAQLAENTRQLERLASLKSRGFAAQSEEQTAETAVEMARARVAQLQAELDVARLPARQAEIIAARGAVEEAQATLENTRWQLAQRTIRAPSDGVVSDVVLRSGEIAGPAAPVVSFLPDGATKLKLYVPQSARAGLAPGTVLDVRCDGCKPGQHARVSYVANEPEFTPPVIYSLNNRQKLVYLVEARPEGDAAQLMPGQIVDVQLPEPVR